MEQLFYVGSYSLQGVYFPEANGDGVTTYSLSLKTGAISKKSGLPVGDTGSIAKSGTPVCVLF